MFHILKRCLWHGHAAISTECQLSKGLTAHSNTPFNKLCIEAYGEWLNKKAKLEALNYTVVSKWECQYIKERLEDPHLASFLAEHYQHRPLERLVLRRGLRGGRTESMSIFISRRWQPYLT